MGDDGGMKEVCERQERRATFNEKSRCLDKRAQAPIRRCKPAAGPTSAQLFPVLLPLVHSSGEASGSAQCRLFSS